MSSELRALLERLGPVQAVCHTRSFSDRHEAVLLRRDRVPFVTAVGVARRLFAAGMPMRQAHAAMAVMALHCRVTVDIPVDGDIGRWRH